MTIATAADRNSAWDQGIGGMAAPSWRLSALQRGSASGCG